jgi:hypothetical protein
MCVCGARRVCVRFFVVQQDISRPARVISSVRVISRPARVISSDRVISRPARVISSDRVISRPARVISSDRVISSRAQVISRGRDVSRRPESLCSRVILSPLRMTRSAQDDSVRYETSHVARRATVKCMRKMKTIMHPNQTVRFSSAFILVFKSMCHKQKGCAYPPRPVIRTNTPSYHHHASRIHGTPHRAIVCNVPRGPPLHACAPTHQTRQAAGSHRQRHTSSGAYSLHSCPR